MLENLPVLLLKKLVLLPYQEVKLELNIDASKKIVDLADKYYSKKLLVVCPNDLLESNPDISDLPRVGVLSKIKSCIKLPNGNYRATIIGLNRVLVREYRNHPVDNSILEGFVKRLYIDTSNKDIEEPIIKSLKGALAKYMEENPNASNSVANTIANVEDLDMLTDIITNYLPFDEKKKVSYMNTFDYVKRANELIKDINLELQVINIETKIDDEIRESFEKEQRDYIIKQKINKLNAELGLNVDKQTEVDLFYSKIDELNLPKRVSNKLINEVKKYAYTSETNPDSSVIRNYLDTVLSLPWNNSSVDETDIKKIMKSLDKTHFGMDEAKQRIIEHIAVQKNSDKINAPIICLVGPPGTGKTTLGMSISKALNREFYKISVGGLNDPTELTGHKRTYLGASPGKIIQGIKKCNTNNPLFLIDEVDKIVSDFKGDPSAVLLEILDHSQNNQFIDNYVEEPFDLSKVMFILTANDVKSIPSALKDRLEIIYVSSYTELEKVEIGKKCLIPKICEEYNTKKIRISDELLLTIINGYTLESGVREFDRLLRKIYRNVILEDNDIKSLNSELLKKYLGLVKYDKKITRNIHPGNTSTLGVTPYGGVIINIESILTPGDGKLNITGNVEGTLIESINIAYTYVISNAKNFGLDPKKILSNNIHMNILNAAMKKNGSSGGVAFATSFISLLLGKEVSSDVGFTGEITLHGDICKVGGIKEKIIGAYNNGFKKLFIPLENINDLSKVPNIIKESIDIRCVSSYQDVFDELFKKHK